MECEVLSVEYGLWSVECGVSGLGSGDWAV